MPHTAPTSHKKKKKHFFEPTFSPQDETIGISSQRLLNRRFCKINKGEKQSA
jgi:hypothetical protein